MNSYGARMRDHYAQYRATELAAIADPERFFEELGEQIAQEVSTLADQISGPTKPEEGYMDRVGRMTEARMSAESEILREHMSRGLSQP